MKFSVIYLLCKVDINPEDNHQDDCGGDKNCEGDIGSLHAVIHILDNYKRKKKSTNTHTHEQMFVKMHTQKKRNINILMLQCSKT